VTFTNIDSRRSFTECTARVTDCHVQDRSALDRGSHAYSNHHRNSPTKQQLPSVRQLLSSDSQAGSQRHHTRLSTPVRDSPLRTQDLRLMRTMDPKARTRTHTQAQRSPVSAQTNYMGMSPISRTYVFLKPHGHFSTKQSIPHVTRPYPPVEKRLSSSRDASWSPGKPSKSSPQYHSSDMYDSPLLTHLKQPFPHVVDERYVDGEGWCYIYADGTHCPKALMGNQLTQLGYYKGRQAAKATGSGLHHMPREEDKVPTQPSKCDQCHKSGRECRLRVREWHYRMRPQVVER